MKSYLKNIASWKPQAYPLLSRTFLILVVSLLFVIPVSAETNTVATSNSFATDIQECSVSASEYIESCLNVTIPANYNGTIFVNYSNILNSGAAGHSKVCLGGVCDESTENDGGGTWDAISVLFSVVSNSSDRYLVIQYRANAASQLSVKNMSVNFSSISITSPSNNSAQTSRTVNITTNWSGLSSFQYQVDTNSDFSSPYINSTSSTNYSGNQTFATGLNYIRVKGCSGSACTTWSNANIITLYNTFSVPDFISYYRFENNGNDENTTNNNTVVLYNGLTYNTSGNYTTSLLFDGTNDIGNITHNASLNFSTSFSFTGWLNPDTIGETAGRIFEKPNSFYGFTGSNVGVTNYYLALLTSTGTCQFNSTEGSILDKWTHVVFTYNLTQQRIYLNGVNNTITVSNTNCDSINLTSNNLYLGNRVATDRSYKGLMDEIRFYNRVLTPDEVSAIYANPYDIVPNMSITITSPNNGTLIEEKNISISFTSPEPTGTYQIQASQNSNYSSPFYDTNITTLSHSFNLQGRGEYYLRVRYNDGTNIGTWQMRNVTSSYLADVPAPKAIWDMSELAGTKVFDHNPNMNHLYFMNSSGTNAKWRDAEECRSEGCILFNASNKSYLHANRTTTSGSNFEVLELNKSAWTIMVKHKPINNQTGTLFSRRTNGNTAGYSMAYKNGNVTFEVIDSNGNPVNVSHSVENNTWYITTVIYIGTNISIYDNTVLKHFITTTDSFNTSNVDEFYVGTINSSTGYVSAYLDWIKIFDDEFDSYRLEYMTREINLIEYRTWGRNSKHNNLIYNPANYNTVLSNSYRIGFNITWNKTVYTNSHWYASAGELDPNSPGLEILMPTLGGMANGSAGCCMGREFTPSLYQYSSTGTEMWNWSRDSLRYLTPVAEIADLNGDFISDIHVVAGGLEENGRDPNEKMSFAIDKYGDEYVWYNSTIPIDYWDYGIYSATIKNVLYRTQQQPQIIFNTASHETSAGSGELVVLYWNGTVAYRYTPVFTDGQVNSIPAAEDFDNDGIYEIVLGSDGCGDYGAGCNRTGLITIINAENGTFLANRTLNASATLNQSSAPRTYFVVNDIDNNGYLDMIFGNRDGHIYDWEYYNGDFVEKWNISSGPTYAVGGMPGTVVDIDHDGEKEYIDGGYVNSTLRIINSSGQIERSTSSYGSMTVVNDIDNDGDYEFIIYSNSGNSILDENFNLISSISNTSLSGAPRVFADITGDNILDLYYYTISLNQTPKNWTHTLVSLLVDNVTAGSITNLQNTTTSSSINWTWTDPSDNDLDSVIVYVNDIWQSNVTAGTQYYLASSLSSNTTYTISTRTVDTVGNINQTWVNQTTMTASANYTPPSPTSLSVTSGNFYANYSWSPGSGNTTNSYNVSITNNSIQTWMNGSNQTWFNATNLSAGWWSNISVYSYNSSGSGTLNQTPASMNTQMNTTPNITSWSNTKTNNNTLSFQVNITETVTFNATADQTINSTGWQWYLGDYDYIVNNNNYTHQFLASNRTINITVHATNDNGTSTNVTWSVYVLDNGSYIPPVVSPSFVPYTDTYIGFTEFVSHDSYLNWTDNKVKIFNETTGGATHYIDFYTNSSSVTNASGTFNITSNIFYLGKNPHIINVTVYNFTSSTYDLSCGTISQYTTPEYNNCTSVSNTHYRNSTGITIIRLDHSFGGVPSHRLYVDQIQTTLGLVPNTNPNITSWSNDYTNNNNLSISVPKETNITFNITANQTLTSCSWVGATQINCSSSSYAYKLFNTIGTSYVNVTGSSSNGTLLNSKNWTITVTDTNYTPPSPTSLSNTTGNFWVNHTWSPGSGNTTNSYNVSVNSIWYNGTTSLFNNTTSSPHGWVNISVYSYNSSGSLNSTPLSQNTQIPNNPITISNLSSSYIVQEGQVFSINADYTDTDNDIGIFSDNSSEWNIASSTGIVSWTTDYADNNTYNYNITVSDGNGSVSYQIISVTVTNTPLTIISTTPASNPTTTVGDSQEFTADTNRTSTHSWYLNSSLIQTNTSVTSSTYTNNTSSIGNWNITIIVSDSIDTTSNTWVWNVTAIPVYSISGYVFDNNNNPLQSATVFNGSNTSSTNSLGYYQITGMYNGSYNITFNKTGYSNSYSNITITGSSLTNQNKTIYDNSSPTQVTLTQGTISTTTINISWTQSSDTNLWGYQIYRNNVIVSNTTNTYYNDTGLSVNTTYQYIVRANDTYNNWGTNSSTLSITTNNTYSMSGYIINSTDVLSGANINCSCGSAVSNATGYYIIDNLLNGTHSFTISKTGYDNNVTQVTISGENKSQNFTLTLTPVTPPSSGGGGGSTVVTPKPTTSYVDIQDKNNNPPLLNIVPTLSGATIKLQNEGTASQEYIINWNIKNAMGQILDSGIESKKVNPLEIFELPISITAKQISGLYILEVVVQYGIYQSKTSKVFYNDASISMDTITSILTTIVLIMITVALIYYIRNERRKSRRL